MAGILSSSSELSRAQSLLKGAGASTALTRSSEEREEQWSKNLPSWLKELVLNASLTLQQRNAIKLRTSFLGISLLLLALLSSKLVWVLFFPAYSAFEWQLLKNKVIKRARAFERDYTALLLSLASGVRTGLDPIVALSQAGELFSKGSVIRSELENFRSQIEKGVTEECAIRSFASSIAHPDIFLFRSAMMLARKEGSSLSVCLERLARVTRQRQSFRRKVQAAVALQKLSAMAIAVCAIIIIIIQYSANSAAFLSAWNHPVASRIIYLGFGLVLLGIVWLGRMAKGGV